MIEPLTTFTSGTEIALKIITTGILVVSALIGAAIGYWKFWRQKAYEAKWDVTTTSTRVRRAVHGGRPQWAYHVDVRIVNASLGSQRLHGWWRRVLLPCEVDEKYDPDDNLSDSAIAVARKDFDEQRRKRWSYPLSPGEAFTSQIIHFSDRPLQEICYVEYALLDEAREAGDQKKPSLYQVTIAPVEREDLQGNAGASPGGNNADEEGQRKARQG